MSENTNVKNFENFLNASTKKPQRKFTNPEYKKHIVAFVDMLGMSEYMENIDVSKVAEASEKYRTIISISEKFKALCDIASHEIASENTTNFSRMEISDSFVLSVPLAYADYLIKLLSELQYSLFINHNFLLRGAISYDYIIGNIDNDRIIGPAFIRSHKLELKNVIFPRIVIDRTIEKFNNELIEKDNDGFLYINFLKNHPDRKEIFKMKDKINNTIENEIEKHINDASIIQKWMWLKNFTYKSYKDMEASI